MAFKETARNAVDQVRSLPDKAKKFSKATALAVLMAVGGAAASDAEAQTTYLDTIPEEHKNLVLVYVTDQLLETLDMTTEEFYEQKVKKDFDWLNKSHYYSGNTNDTNQIVEIVAGDQVQELSTEGLPDEMSSGDAHDHLREEDGVRDHIKEEEACIESHSTFLYGKRTDKGVNGGHISVVSGDMLDNVRAWHVQHEMFHNYDGLHYQQGGTPRNRPTRIDSLTPRVVQFADIRHKKGYLPKDPNFLLGKRTVGNGGQKMGIYASPEIREDNSESDVIRMVREKLASYDPLLEADILPPADSLEVNEMATLEADINRDEIEEYEFNWTVWQDGQVVYTGTGPTINYMPTDTGMLEVELFAQKACGGQAAEKTMQLNVVDGTTSVDNTYLNAIKLGPNPTNGMVELIGDTHTLDAVRIYTQEGLPLVELDGAIQQIDFSRWPAGMYHLQLIGQDGAVANKKVVKVQ